MDELGLPLEARPAYHAALLSFLAMENLAGNIPALTGAGEPRILGQITPGSTSNWDNWVCNLADQFDISQKRAA